MTSRAKSLIVLAAALALAASLTGCSSIAKTITSAMRAATTPAVGDCWSGSAAAVEYSGSFVGAKVSCDLRHDTYTFAVDTIDGNTPKTWLKQGTKSTVVDSVLNDESDLCFTEEEALIPRLDFDYELLFEFTYHLPTLAEWREGARWVRCDLSLIEVGSKWNDFHFAALPKNAKALVADAEKNPKKYRACINTSKTASDSADPLNDDSATFADCSANPQWYESATAEYPQLPSAPYPSDDVRQAQYQQSCFANTDPSLVVVAYGPSEHTWTAYDDRFVECWASAESGGAS